MGNKEKKKIELWRIIVFVLAVAFIIFMWVKKDIAALYSNVPKEELLPLIVTSVAVSLFKFGVIAGAVLLIRWIVSARS